MTESQAEAPRPRTARSRRRARKRHSPVSRAVARWMFRIHLWIGVLVTALVILVSITGILLNHKRAFGLMPDVEHAGSGLPSALPLDELAQRAADAAGAGARAAGVDRMDVRPSDGLVKVRFGDAEVTEVTMDLASGKTLDVGRRNDVFLEKLHSGEIFGGSGILLSDAAAATLVLLVVSGFWMWLYPRSRL